MTINRNFLFLEAFTVILIFSIFGDIQEYVALLISNHPNDYLLYLGTYIVIIAVLLFVIYKVTYKPPKYEKIVNKAQLRQENILSGLKTKIEKIDDKQKKKEEKTKAKALKAQEKAQEKAQKIQKSPVKKTTHSKSSKSSHRTSSYKSPAKPKATRRRK